MLGLSRTCLELGGLIQLQEFNVGLRSMKTVDVSE